MLWYDESHAKQHDKIINDQQDWKYQLGDSLHLYKFFTLLSGFQGGGVTDVI